MSGAFGWVRRFIRELRRRRVIRVAVVYAGTGFVILEAADILQPALRLPSWTVRLVTVLLILGFPLAVGLAWVFDVTEGGLVRTEEEGGVPDEIGPGGKPLTSNVILVGLLIVAIGLLLYPRLFVSGEGTSGPSSPAAPGTAQVEERSIAVLPFEVTGSGAETWRDGMVTILTLNLDGAAGLRAIPDRRVFAAARQVDSARIEGDPAADPALQVARQAGAKYAVMGSAVQVGEDLRLGAQLRETASGDRLGQVEVQGMPDSIKVLTNRLTRRLLGVLLEESEEEVPSVDLASITTSSLEALKAYLRGERHLRAGEYEAAIQGYRAATEEDSTFALAYARLGLSRAWSGASGQNEAFYRAHSLSSRLPLREQRIVWARYARHVLDRTLAVADSLRALTEVYPDDPQIWYNLGEMLFHGYIPGGWEEAEEAFLKATELDPGVAPYHQHLMDVAMSLHRDSALATRRIESHPDGPMKDLYRVSRDLVFAAPEEQEAALARLGTLSLPQTQRAWWAGAALQHPKDRALQARVIETLRAREDTDPEEYVGRLATNRFDQGQVEGGLSLLREAGAMRCYTVTTLRNRGLPVPDSTLRQAVEPSTLGAGASWLRLFCAGLWAVEEGRGEKLPQILSWIKQGAGESSVEGAAQWAERVDDELKGRRAYRAGNLKRAARLWSGSKFGTRFGALWRGDLYRDLGQLETAERWYRAAWVLPEAHERLGQLYEEMGKPEKAAAAYERFIAAWKDADPELQDRVQKARQRLEALGKKRAAE